jgi:hypothetical protein
MRKGIEMETCFVCNGPLGFLGILGFLIHFRCVNCGMEIHREVQENDWVYTDQDEKTYQNFFATI